MDMKNKSTEEIRNYIRTILRKEKGRGKMKTVLLSGDIHKDLELTRCMPSVCNAMYSVMGSDDVVLHTTPSGRSSTIKIEYNLY